MFFLRGWNGGGWENCFAIFNIKEPACRQVENHKVLTAFLWFRTRMKRMKRIKTDFWMFILLEHRFTKSTKFKKWWLKHLLSDSDRVRDWCGNPLLWGTNNKDWSESPTPIFLRRHAEMVIVNDLHLDKLLSVLKKYWQFWNKIFLFDKNYLHLAKKPNKQCLLGFFDKWWHARIILI